MANLTEDQERVLNYIDAFGGAQPHAIRSELRGAFYDLEALGLIAQFTEYRLTDAGRTIINDPVSSQKDSGK